MHDARAHPYTNLYSLSVKVWGICRVTSFVKVFALKHYCRRIFDSFDGYFVAHKSPDVVDPISGRVDKYIFRLRRERLNLPDHRGTF